ncbi:response regulator [Natrinema sp. 1APR25-10V2]|uniref:response regulator n=1 Tax=Natrinema sp. 1APR25-10V2 TaxID=2951081 RepID=UPI00287664D5|nr:response regulator [Natrinema sp. 1APR25-10V2]MDS0476597.1 response regulator [Natrinema sp. 1APR25-10V2]
MTDQSLHNSSENGLTILLVEDNPGDIRLIREAFETANVGAETTLHPISNGDDAVAFLTERTDDETRPFPDLALVDLNLPGRDGCAVLDAIRDDPRLRPLPVIILTSSADRDDIDRCYDAHANAYVTKPTAPDEFESLAASVGQFWFQQVQLPPVQ